MYDIKGFQFNGYIFADEVRAGDFIRYDGEIFEIARISPDGADYFIFDTYVNEAELIGPTMKFHRDIAHERMVRNHVNV